MKIIQTISQFQHIPKGCVLSIGNFDGVHVGHQEILAVARQAAENNDAELIAMTFEPHPVAALYPERAPGVLTPLALKKHVLAQCGCSAGEMEPLLVREDILPWEVTRPQLCY